MAKENKKIRSGMRELILALQHDFKSDDEDILIARGKYEAPTSWSEVIPYLKKQ